MIIKTWENEATSMEPFQQYLDEKFPEDGKHSTSGVVHLSISEWIKDCLKDPSSADKTFRFYVKKEHLEFLNLPNLGLIDVLVVPSSDAVQVCPGQPVYKPFCMV